jgi:hypothetical protein
LKVIFEWKTSQTSPRNSSSWQRVLLSTGSPPVACYNLQVRQGCPIFALHFEEATLHHCFNVEFMAMSQIPGLQRLPLCSRNMLLADPSSFAGKMASLHSPLFTFPAKSLQKLAHKSGRETVARAGGWVQEVAGCLRQSAQNRF